MINSEVKNADFFDKSKDDKKSEKKAAKSRTNHPDNETVKQPENSKHDIKRGKDQFNDKAVSIINETKSVLQQSGFKDLTYEISRIEKSLNYDKFKIVVVGEFNRGKSTFINKLVHKDILPTGNLPTTALLTKVTHNVNEMMVYVDQKGAKKSFPLIPESWTGLVADSRKVDPQGVVFVGLNDDWLKQKGIEIIDTPGAGDLNEKRTLLVNDALLCGDGAVITISARQALSLTEKAFINERLIVKKVSYLLVVLTHLDQLEPENRSRLLNNVIEKLKIWDVNIPVFIPQDHLEIPGEDCSNIMGIDNIKKEIEKWTLDDERQKLKLNNLCTQLLSVLDIAQASMNDKLELLAMDDEKRNEVFINQNKRIEDLKAVWDDLKSKLLTRSKECCNSIEFSVEEKTNLIIEKLRFESEHSNNPKQWWEKDYPYRLKIEMINLAASLENEIVQIYSNDARWFNDSLSKQFNSGIFIEKKTLIDKSLFKETKPTTSIEIEDINKKRALFRIGTGAVTVLGYILFAGMGPAAMVNSVCVGTGSAVISEKIFGGTIKQQREALNKAIETDVQKVIGIALVSVKKRLEEVYADINMEASKKEEMWEKTQIETITNTSKQAGNKNTQETEDVINRINETKEKISCMR